jgi:hypothetical protein
MGFAALYPSYKSATTLSPPYESYRLLPDLILRSLRSKRLEG